MIVCALGAGGLVFAQASALFGMPPDMAGTEEAVGNADATVDNFDNTDAAGGQAKTPNWMAGVTFFGESDWEFVAKIAVRFLLNIIFAYILICRIFSKEHRIREYSFCFFISNILIFMVTSLLASVKVKTGFAFGLFAILSILRYRTEQINIREMTFLFTSIIMGVINSLATDGLTIFAVLLADTLLCISIEICDRAFMGETDQVLLVYDNTGLLAKEKKQELHDDIKNRFGYDVVKVVVTKMNYLTDSAEVKLVYKRG
jgi:hypothetical protein